MGNNPTNTNVNNAPPFNNLMYNQNSLDITRFGADPTGVLSSWPAIMTAIGIATALGGGLIYYPPGIYTVNATVPDVQAVTHSGAGPDVTTVKATGDFPVYSRSGSNTIVINTGGVQHMTIRGFWNQNPAQRNNSLGISCIGSNGARYEDIRFVQCYQAFYAKFNYEVFMEKLVVLGSGADQSYIGFYQDAADLVSVNNALIATNCVASFTMSHGWRIVNCNGSLYTACTGEGCGGNGWNIGSTTVLVQPCQFGQWVNCIGDSSALDNWLIQGQALGQCAFLEFSNCWSGNAGLASWDFINVQDTQHTGCNGVRCNTNSFVFNNAPIQVTGYQARLVNQSSGGYAAVNIANTNGAYLTAADVPGANGGRSIDENGTTNNSQVMGCKAPNGGQLIGAGSIWRDNIGCVTELKGTTQFLATNTSKAVAISMLRIPAAGEISLVADANTPLWVTAIGAGTFTINMPAAAGTINVGWSIRFV